MVTFDAFIERMLLVMCFTRKIAPSFRHLPASFPVILGIMFSLRTNRPFDLPTGDGGRGRNFPAKINHLANGFA